MAVRTIAKLATPQPRKPRPPARSGWVGVRSRSSRDTRKRNQAQSPKTQTQRKRKKRSTGKLTKLYHQPAGVIVASKRAQLEPLNPRPTTSRDTAEKAMATIAMATSATAEF